MSTEIYKGVTDGWKSLLTGEVLGEPSENVLWPGHQPNKQYRGLWRDDPLVGNVSVYRWYDPGLNMSKQNNQINSDHNKGRIPWISFKGGASWASISAGNLDSSWRQMARQYAAYTKPVLLTFYHEPVGNGYSADWVSAFLHILNVMEDEVGSLNQTTYCPIIDAFFWHDWYYPYSSKSSHGTPWDWMTDEIIERCGIIGEDDYGKSDVQERALNDMRSHGLKSIGIAEYGRGPAGAADSVSPWPNAATEFKNLLDLYDDNKDILSVTSFFDSRTQRWGNESSPFGTGVPQPLGYYLDYLEGSCWMADVGY